MTTRDSARPTYLYIAGRGRSGTTLLNTLLGNHTDICAVGELANFSLQCFRDENTRWQGLCGCGKRPFNCPFWTQVIQRIEQSFSLDLRNDPFAWRMSDVGVEEEYRSRTIIRAPLVAARHRLWRVIRSAQYLGSPVIQAVMKAYKPQAQWVRNRCFAVSQISDVSGCSIVADTSKDYMGMRDVYDYGSLPTKIIYVTRDCRGNVWSKLRTVESEATRRRLIVENAEDWVKINSRILRALDSVRQEDQIHIRYEDICRSPAKTMSEVLTFVGLDYSEKILEIGENAEHTIAGNRMRFSGKNAGIKEDFSWQDNLHDEDLSVIRSICAPLATRLGYSL